MRPIWLFALFGMAALCLGCMTDEPADDDTTEEADESWCDGNALVFPDGSSIDCTEVNSYCGESEHGEAACIPVAGGGPQNPQGTPTFLAHPLDYDATVHNGWYYNYAENGANHPHYAIDFEAEVGTPLYAACGGVAMVSSQYANGAGYGRFIQLRCDTLNPDGLHYHLLYAHAGSGVDAIPVYPENDRWNTDYDDWLPVSRGDLIGESGSEDTSWPHLHFEVQVGCYAGGPVDPYDIYAETTSADHSAEQEYPPDGERFTSCGPNYLWVTCPPRPAGIDPGIEVTNPVGGETWYYDHEYSIEWETENITSNLQIHLYRGGDYLYTAAADEPDDGEYPFVPLESMFDAACDYQVCVSTTDDAVSDCSGDFCFDHIPAGLEVIYPVGGEVLVLDETYEVLWSPGDVETNVKVEVYQGGTLHTQLAADDPNDGSLEFVPASGVFDAGDDYHLCVAAVDDSSSDCGDLFSIEAVAIPLTVGCGGDHATPQSAVDAAADGDTISVCAGTYSGQTVVEGKTLTIEGAGENVTWLTAAADTPIFIARDSAVVILSDITVSNGSCSGAGYCGVYASSAELTLQAVTVENITGSQSPGVKAMFATMSLDDVSILNVAATGTGGGLSAYWSDLTLQDVTIDGCESLDYGGGIYSEGSTLVASAVQITSNVAGTFGGGIYLAESTASFDGGSIIYNESENGAGILVSKDSSATFTTVDLQANESSVGTGGAAYVRNGVVSDLSEMVLDACDLGVGGGENSPMDIEVQDHNSDEQSFDWTGIVSTTCSVPSGICS